MKNEKILGELMLLKVDLPFSGYGVAVSKLVKKSNAVAEITIRVENQPGFWDFLQRLSGRGLASQVFIELPEFNVARGGVGRKKK